MYTLFMNEQDIRTAIEAQQMIQMRNKPTSELWKEASENLASLGAMLNKILDAKKKDAK